MMHTPKTTTRIPRAAFGIVCALTWLLTACTTSDGDAGSSSATELRSSNASTTTAGPPTSVDAAAPDDLVPQLPLILTVDGQTFTVTERDGVVQVGPARDETFPATRLDPDNPWVGWALDSIARSSGKKPALLPNLGGSLPNDAFSEILGLPTIWVPHSYPGCQQHAPDEHLPVAIAREGLAMMAGLYWDLGTEAGQALPRRG